MDYLFYNYFKEQLLKPFVFQLAQKNNINLKKVDKMIESNISGVRIVNGEIIYEDKFPNWDMIIHEMCHVMIVEPELRHLVSGDTQKAYKEINVSIPINKEMRRESVVFGLQQLIYSKYFFNWSTKGFYTGNVGINHSMDSLWLEKAKSLDFIDYNDIICKSSYNPLPFTCNTVPVTNKKLVVLIYDYEINDYKLCKAVFNYGNFYINDKKYLISEIYKWCYDYDN